MRSRVLDRQKVWWVTAEEKRQGMDQITVYGKPEMHKQVVSATAGVSAEISPGLVPNYDREITSYDKDFSPEEGTQLFVDVIPKIGSDGNLVMSEDGVTPVTLPDYRMVEAIRTQKGKVIRYGIAKIAGNNR